MTPNYGVAFATEVEEADVHATYGTKLTQTGKPVICHVCGKNHYAKRCRDREQSTPGKKADKAEEIPKKEIPPTKASLARRSDNTRQFRSAPKRKCRSAPKCEHALTAEWP